MIDVRPHKVWMCLLALAFVVGAGNAPFLGLAEEKAEHKRIELQKENEKTAEALRQLREDIADAEKMKTEIDGDAATRYLAPVDRLRAAQILEHRAAEAHLTHFA
jgi:hypothetical protein